MSASGRLRLYFETARHLRPAQVFGRMRLLGPWPKPDLASAPPLRAHTPSRWIAPARRRPSQLGPDAFCFLNETRSLAERGWDDAGVSKLWRYNLHYFDDLNAKDATERADWHRALIARWIEENPPAEGTGWEPYPTSLRIVNWIKWARAGNALAPQTLHSLAVQVRWLSRRLEYHLLGNHLFANAKALVFAGCFFDGSEAEGWLDLGLRILAREVPEQILPDGGHFELSTMYHALALEDMLDLVNVTRSAGLPVPHSWDDKIASMRGWLVAMSHPDGEISFFNDAAIGIAPSPNEVDGYALRLGFAALAPGNGGLTWLHDSGYIRLEGERAVALLDVASAGPDYLPGHAHADTLSFELSVDGQRIIVNSGTSLYSIAPERLRQRGTAAHNTVVVDGENSSEVWSSFRVARRARPQGLSVSGGEGEWTVTCAHDGYTRLPGRPRHLRAWHFGKDTIAVHDTIRGYHREAFAIFHFHPALSPWAAADGLSGSLAGAPSSALHWRIEKGRARLEPSTWHPEFGIGQAAQRLVVALESGESVIAFSWAAS